MRLAPLLFATLFLIPFGTFALVDVASADPSDIETGDERAAFNRRGTRLVTKPKPLSKLVKLLPYGTKLEVTEVKGRWLKVKETGAGVVAADAKTGWLKGSQTVQPFALTQGGQLQRTSQGTGQVSRRDAAAAARQFSPTTEAAHRQASAAAVRDAYKLLDSLLEVTKPTIEEVAKFVGEGRLGRPDTDEVDTPEPVPVEMPALPEPIAPEEEAGK